MSETPTPTTTDISVGQKILLLPLGSWEQHGPHLPLDTDSVIISRVVNDSLSHHSINSDNYLCSPLMPITASDEHRGFPGGLSTGTDALVKALIAICTSAHSWAAGILIVNGHGGNYDALQMLASALDHQKITHSIWSLPSYSGGDMHAGHTETSLMMHIAPQHVHLERIENLSSSESTVEQLRLVGVQGVSASGVIGNPSTATARHGQDVLHLYVRSLVERMNSCAAEWLHFSA